MDLDPPRSGSRWEPLPPAHTDGATTTTHEPAPRRRNRSLLVLLLSVLTLGAASGGIALAHEAGGADAGRTGTGVPAAGAPDLRGADQDGTGGGHVHGVGGPHHGADGAGS
jgi:hypothetical protein